MAGRHVPAARPFPRPPVSQVGHIGRHRRVGQSRHDRVHVDAVRRVFPGRAAGEGGHAGLGGRVGDAAQIAAAMLRGDGRHVDDAAVVLRAHAFDGLFDGQEVGGQVDREDPVPAFQIRIIQ